MGCVFFKGKKHALCCWFRRYGVTFVAGFMCMCQALACNSSLTVVFEMNSLSFMMITKRSKEQMQQLLMPQVHCLLKIAGAHCCLGNRKTARLVTLYQNHDAYSGLWFPWNPLFQSLAVSALSFCSPALEVCPSIPDLSVMVQSLVL